MNESGTKTYGYVDVTDLLKNGPVGCTLFYEKPSENCIKIKETWVPRISRYIYTLYYKGVKLRRSYDDLTLESLSEALSMLKGFETMDAYGLKVTRPIRDRRAETLKKAGIWAC